MKRCTPLAALTILAILAPPQAARGAEETDGALREFPAILTPGQSLELDGEYFLSRPVVVPRDARLHGTARLRAHPKAALPHLLQLESGAVVEGLTLDGSLLAVPAPAWSEIDGPPSGVGMILMGTLEIPLTNVRVARCTFENFPGGGVFARFTMGVTLEGLVAKGMQQQAEQETCAVFAFYDSHAPRIVDCDITHYRWKGFYFKHCTDAIARNDFTRYGPPDHASHYARLCRSVAFIGGGAEDAFGVKTFGSDRVRVEGMTFARSTTGIFIDATTRADVIGNRISESSRQGIIVGSEERFRSTAQVRVAGNVIVTSCADATPNSSGVQLVSLGTGSAVSDIEIADNDISGYLWAISFLPGAQPRYADIRVRENRCVAIRQYGIVGPVARVQILRNCFTLDGPGAQGFVTIWPDDPHAESLVLLEGNTWTGDRDFGVELGQTGGTFSQVISRDNRHVRP